MSTPVALIIFNRPDVTERVVERIAAARPSQLLVVADGPRAERTGERELCAATRAIVERIDWDCQVFTNYADANMGCKRRVSSGIDWVFEQVESAIFLEDDCLPHPSFFPYCEELLERHRDDERVMMISGDNFQQSTAKYNYSYYYSRYVHIWGWASWRRAWRGYDVDMSLWPIVRANGVLEDVLGDSRAASAWREIFDAVYADQIDTWDYQWVFACWMQHGLSILPSVNLVSNIGFGAAATHTTAESPLAERAVEAMHFPLCHPPYMVRDSRADSYTQTRVFGSTRLLDIARGRALRTLGRVRRSLLRSQAGHQAPKPRCIRGSFEPQSKLMTLDEAVRYMRSQPVYADLVRDAYLGPDVADSARRFARSGEFEEVKRLLRGVWIGGTVLDLGAGTGIASRAFADAGARHVYAVEPDPSDEVGRGAIRRLSKGMQIDIVAAFGDELPVPDASVDLVYTRQVLHHIQDLPATLRECARVLKPGGIFMACREHVADDKVQLQTFLASHPTHQLAGGENAYPEAAYADAILGSGLTLERTLGPWESVINAFPVIRSQTELRDVARQRLRARLGWLGSVAHMIPPIRAAMWTRLTRPVPGRMYSFIARKPTVTGA